MTLIACYLVFYDDIPIGADMHFHFGNIHDKYKTILDGYNLSAISGIIGTGIGVGGGLFYSPFSPRYQMEISVNEAGLIQMPLIYYPGYKITLTDESGEKQILNGKNIDGLVIFTVNEGTYTVKTDHNGTPFRKASIVLTSLGAALVVCALFYKILKKNKNHKD